MNTKKSLRNNRLRQELEVNPSLQKVIAVYHIIQINAIIICVAVSINSLQFYFLISAYIPITLFVIFWVASKCNFQDLVIILVHFNPILSSMYFLVVFPVLVATCILYLSSGIFNDYLRQTADVRVAIIAVMTGIMSLSSAVFGVMGIWKSARKVVLSARFDYPDPVDAVGYVPLPCEEQVTFIDPNDKHIGKAAYGDEDV
ncbi:hypothetical protein CHS0354_039555 [Potamilus streckersoni]|uniref:Uncharacterized protein n=1 Tax=Potamilus streckersoni TaxID=2493646 RepID=A0AAE0SUW5_9BIVA|nr:hypothetical protein CHS0354_039555 [Potamilus streckersoni]